MLSVIEAAALLACLSPALYYGYLVEDSDVVSILCTTALVSMCCYVVTVLTIPQMAGYLARRGLKGRDMGRRGTPKENEEIPSALGLIAGIIYLVFIIVTQMWGAKDNLGQLADYSAALLSICFMVLLGFADDVLDLPWRYKLLLPTVAALPLVATYRGVTTVLVPNVFRSWVLVPGENSLGPLGWTLETVGLASVDRAAHGAIIDLGAWYLLYMLLLAVFATNAINIYAGINGLEAGQSIIIGVAILTANLYELAAGAGLSSPHMFSAKIIMPFLAASAGLMYHNAFPATVFVGDTYCYFAGMTLACCAILGHFSKTLLLFLIPQIFNFLYSCPQLFKIYECPRHRLPTYDAATDTMRPSTFVLEKGSFEETGTKTAVKGSIAREKVEKLVLQKLSPNMTLINLLLTITGPMHERTTTNALLVLQVACCAIGLGLRYSWAPTLATPHPSAV